jgi:hypothetical protein
MPMGRNSSGSPARRLPTQHWHGPVHRGMRPTNTRPALEGSPCHNQCVGSRTRVVHPRATPTARHQLWTVVDGGLWHDRVTLGRGWRGDDAAQGKGSSLATSRRQRHGLGRQPALAAIGHTWLSGDPRDGGGKEWVWWCLAPAGLIDLHTGLTGARVDNEGATGGDLRRKWREVRRPVIGARGGESRQHLPRDGWRRRARTATVACGFGPGAATRRPDTAARQATASGGAERSVRTGTVSFGQRRQPPVGALWRGRARGRVGPARHVARQVEIAC